MKIALEEAQKAYAINEVPIGAVIVYKDQIIGRGYNRRNTDKSTLAHAEILAMEEAMAFIGDWRLEETTMYITLEPCPMCAGAIVQARIPRVVLGAMNPKAGSAGSVVNLLNEPKFNHQVEVEYDVCHEACKAILQDFFKELREQKKGLR
jgi:tRNA(adenine34) deaminase